MWASTTSQTEAGKGISPAGAAHHLCLSFSLGSSLTPPAHSLGEEDPTKQCKCYMEEQGRTGARPNHGLLLPFLKAAAWQGHHFRLVLVHLLARNDLAGVCGREEGRPG